MADTIPEPRRRPPEANPAPTPTPNPDTPAKSDTIPEVHPRLDLLAGPPPPLTELHIPAPEVAEPPPDIPGYEVGAELAHGGMGIVYRARDLGLNREVAIKTLLPKYIGHEPGIARFVREAQITARLPHPGVPPVHAQGQLPDGRPFLAMKLIRGKTLEAILASRERERPEAPVAHAPGSPNLLAIFEAIC